MYFKEKFKLQKLQIYINIFYFYMIQYDTRDTVIKTNQPLE